MKLKKIKFVIFGVFLFAFSHSSIGQESLPGSGGGGCEVSVGCSSNQNDYVRCSGKICERDFLGRSVTCDGVTTSC
jgi:hypothetical protein